MWNNIHQVRLNYKDYITEEPIRFDLMDNENTSSNETESNSTGNENKEG